VIIDVLTLFPEMFTCFTNTSILKRAIDSGRVTINTHNFREYTHDKHHTVDDYTFGGGSGMILKPEPIFETVEAIRGNTEKTDVPVILMSPQGRLFSQAVARELSSFNRFIIVCGRYEGVDERVREHLATDEISIGDYVLSGGELPSMVIIESVVRLIPGVLGSEESALDDSHVAGLLEYPQYTRPAVYRNWSVPDILLSGNHAEIAKWRREQSIERTRQRRPDLIEKIGPGLEAGRKLEKTRKNKN
jgi:tRNA (guanine37-N1)-methyltransferase